MSRNPAKGMPSPRLDEAEFRRGYAEQFQDPVFTDIIYGGGKRQPAFFDPEDALPRSWTRRAS